MAPQSSERSQQDEFCAPWPQHAQLQLDSGDAFSIFSRSVADSYADTVSRGSNTAISGSHHQNPPTTIRYQHLNPANLTGSESLPTDTATYPLPPPFNSSNEVEMPDFPNTQNDLFGPSINPGLSSATTAMVAERPNDPSWVAPPVLYTPLIPTTQRKSRARKRTRKPAPEEWKRHKKTIEHLYIKQNLSLTGTITEMRETHQFYATEKMYKDMFKQWKWSKNLPRGMAISMLNKARRRQPKQSIFEWGNRTWTVDRIKKTHGKSINQKDLDGLEDYPTPQDLICKTPRGTEAVQNLSASEKAQEQESSYELANTTAKIAAKSVGGPIDDGPFRLSSNQSSIADLSSLVKTALEVDKDDNEEEAEWRLRDALSCSSRLLSPTDVKTNEIGYQLASFYAAKKRFSNADDILNWMTNRHLEHIGGGNSQTIVHVFHVISLLRRWERNEEANLLIYRLLESLQNPEKRPVISQISTGLEIVSYEMMGELLAPGDEGKLTILLNVLEGLARFDQNHGFLRHVMPQIIEKCDEFQETESNLAIHSRCILAKILADGTQYERARSILRSTGRPLKHKVDSKSMMDYPTLILVQRVAITFLEANDPEMCDRIIKRVVAIFDTGLAAKKDSAHYLVLIDFLISTSLEIQKRCEWERIRPWIEQALSLSYFLYGRHHSRTKWIEKMLETQNVGQLFSVETVRAFHQDLGTLKTSNLSQMLLDC
ncbi:hypothetical protein GGI43DRAFT_431531 [Trichoderma evansii]